MSKNKKAPARDEKRAAADYYKLNTQAVEDLITADETNSPPVPEEELQKYRSGSKMKMSGGLKILLIKAWFAGAVCWFFLVGLGVYLTNIIDQIVITGLGLGFVMDILQNNLIRFMEKTPGANDPWIFVGVKGFFSLPLSILYAMVLMVSVVATYEGINLLLTLIFRPEAGRILMGVEPICFGMLITAWDALFLWMKRTFRSIVADAKSRVRP